MGNIEEKFEDIRPKDLIKATILDDGKLKSKLFLVIGRSEDKLNCVRLTLSNKIKSNNYLPCTPLSNGRIFYYKADYIYKIDEAKFLQKAGNLIDYLYQEIASGVAMNNQYHNLIDLKTIKLPVTPNSIILKDNEYYLVSSQINENGNYKILKLKRGINESKSLYIMGGIYSICNNENYELNLETDNYLVIGKKEKYKKENKIKKQNQNSNKYEFGDVLLTKKNNNKLIFLTEINNILYCIDFNQLDFFTGITKINKENVVGSCEKLNQKEIEILISKIEKPLVSDKYPLYSDAKKLILEKIKNLKIEG